MRKYFCYSYLLLAFIASCNSPQPVSTDSNTQPEANLDETGPMQAPEIRLPNLNGDTVALSSLKGNVVMVDFWASWCPPCRRENPKVVSMYNRVKDKQLTNGGKFMIYSVSLDDDKLAWMEAIKKDKLSWPNHVSDLRGWNSVVVPAYRIEGIPMKVLIDTTGEVIPGDPSIPEVELFLKERFR